jgi:hypothetical protein
VYPFTLSVDRQCGNEKRSLINTKKKVILF